MSKNTDNVHKFVCDRCGKEFKSNDLSMENSSYRIEITNVSPYNNYYLMCYNCYMKFILFAQGDELLVNENKIKGIMWNRKTEKYDPVYKEDD